MRLLLTCTFILGLTLNMVQVVQAQVTPEQRKELSEITRNLTKVATHIRKKEFAEAEELLSTAESKIDEIASSANVEKTDRALLPAVKAVEKQRAVLARAQGTGTQEAVSFLGDVAGLFQSKCMGCHGEDNPRNNLRLDIFAGWKRGGKSGPLLIPGNAQRSLLMARLAAPQDKGGMPPRGDALTREELELVAKWINGGAKFDGSSDAKPLDDLILEHEIKNSTVVIPKPKGTETVSFTRDIAPWFQNMCVRCHNAQRKSGGLSLVSFYDMMKGGDSGIVIHPGDAENSRLFRLTGGLENPRMPNDNQVRITRKNYEDLKKWFAEGNTFDGDDPRTPLTAFVKTPAEMEAEKFARMTEPEFREHRLERSKSQFKRAVPNDTQNIIEGENFILIGSVSQSRLEQVQGWAEAQLAELQKVFGSSNDLWRGRLAIFVMKDRFGYDEFNLVVEQRQAAPEMIGHSRVTPTHEDAYIVLLDVGDEMTETSPGLQASLVDHLTGAFLRRTGTQLPEWILRGTGLALASKGATGSTYFRGLKKSAEDAVKGLNSPAAVFQDSSFSPSMIGPVGYTLVEHLITASGNVKLKQFVAQLQNGQDLNDALRRVYGAEPNVIAQSYLQSLSR